VSIAVGAQTQPEPIAVGARSYTWWYAGFVGGRWPRPPSLAMSPQFTLAEADELRARPLFVSIAVGAQTQPEPIAVGARSYGWWFVGGRWPRPPSLAMNPQFTLAEADELCAIPHQRHRGRRPLLRIITINYYLNLFVTLLVLGWLGLCFSALKERWHQTA